MEELDKTSCKKLTLRPSPEEYALMLENMKEFGLVKSLSRFAILAACGKIKVKRRRKRPPQNPPPPAAIKQQNPIWEGRRHLLVEIGTFLNRLASVVNQLGRADVYIGDQFKDILQKGIHALWKALETIDLRMSAASPDAEDKVDALTDERLEKIHAHISELTGYALDELEHTRWLPDREERLLKECLFGLHHVLNKLKEQ